jgi:hypothetical protein
MWMPIAWLWVYNSLTATVAGLAILLFAMRHLKVARAIGVPALRKTPPESAELA